MPPHDTVIVGAGVISAIGLTLPEAAAAVRARTMRFSESPFRDKNAQPLVMATIPEDALPPLNADIDRQAAVSSRERRLLRLAAQALAQLAPAVRKAAPNAPVIVALPHAEGNVPLDGKRFLDRLAIQSGLALPLASSGVRQGGRAGGLLALSDAGELLQRGVARYVLAGGVDTYRDAKVIARLDVSRRVKSQNNLDAFTPGEGAAFVLLTTRSQALQDGVRPIAVCSSAATAFEEGHLLSSSPYRAEALAVAIAQLAARGDVAGPVADVYSSMNGEHHWGREWAVAFMRQRGLFDPSHGFHHPADSYGEIGAAAGPMLVALAATAQNKQHGRSPALVYCSSDDGPRAALFVHQGA